MTNAPELLLLGDPVAHSRSPAFQNAGLRAIGSPWRYEVRQVDRPGLELAFSALRRGEHVGFNITVPHKALAWSLADARTAAAEASGAANTAWMSGGRLWVDNTDIAGVAASAAALGVHAGPSVVLGAGGAAAAAVIALRSFGDVVVVNRTVANAAALAERMAHGDHEMGYASWDSASLASVFATARLVVNATSLQLVPADVAARAFDALPWGLAAAAAFLDLSYAAGPTRFLERAPEQAPALDGATMLLHQGVAAFERWTGQAAPVDVMRDALADALGRTSDRIG